MPASGTRAVSLTLLAVLAAAALAPTTALGAPDAVPATRLGGPSAQSAGPSLPGSDAGFDLEFELRYEPCADPVFRGSGSAGAEAPPPAGWRGAGADESVSAAATCAAASDL